jgi:glycosyltransferase involved in cell wall biosynthesis
MGEQAIPLSIVICTTRPINTIALLSSLVPQLQEYDQVIAIFDVIIEAPIRGIFSSIHPNKPIEIYYNAHNQGLSFCRNLGMYHAKNPYLIFFDDDVLLPEKVLAHYRYFFSKGLLAIGGPLKLPLFLPAIPRWLPEGFSSLLGIHTYQKRIWGANFGFHLERAIQRNIYFKESLGRKNGGLQSGDEADFLQRYVCNGEESHFLEELFVYHCIDSQRYKATYLIKRAFWQGRSELRKMSIASGFKKEFSRAFLTSSSSPMMTRFVQKTVGFSLFFVFCLGILTEFVMSQKIFNISGETMEN